jgi:hypothetical protein
MAIMVPDSCPARATQGEKRLYKLLQSLLPDNFTVWYEPVIRGRYPDFTILADTFGLLVLEVKGWYPRQISKANDQDVELLLVEEGQSRVERAKNPIRQVREYAFALMDLLKKHPLLCNHAGEHQGKLCFPCGYGVLFTNITAEQLAEAGLGAVFPPEKVICRDELQAMEEAQDDRKTISRLERLLPARFPFDPLTEDQVKTIHGVVHKEVVVKQVPAKAESVPEGRVLPDEAVVLEVLDRKQEQVARSLGDGHRVFFGVAGSGKTVLLLARAKLIAAQDPGKRVLVLCYNRSLAAYLGAQLEADPDYRNIEVRTFHSWAARRTGLSSYINEPFEAYEKRMVNSLLSAQGWSDAERYDAILIDEAHDFDPDWFRCCTQALRDPEAGDLLAAVDGAQSLYGRPRSFTWKSVGVNAVGRSKRLGRNYRNTREILEFAWEVAQAPIVADEETETHVRVQPTEAVRTGTKPGYRACASVSEEQAVIARLVERYKGIGIPERDIGVLYPRKESTRIDGLFAALRKSGEVCWITNEGDPTTRDEFMSRPGVRLTTIHSAKGLEFPVVILTALDQLPNSLRGDEVGDSNLFYVGLTRALEHLAVTWSRRSPFTDRVLRSSKAVSLADS